MTETADEIIAAYNVAAHTVPVTGWSTGDVVKLIELLDAELQRRAHADAYDSEGFLA